MKNLFKVITPLLMAPSFANAAETHTFQNAGNASINCVCVIQRYGCVPIAKSKKEDQATWGSSFPVTAGMRLDLGEKCWRERDKAPAVGGTCACAPDTYEKAKDSFLGTVAKEP